jgi:hypothetical protein
LDRARAAGPFREADEIRRLDALRGERDALRARLADQRWEIRSLASWSWARFGCGVVCGIVFTFLAFAMAVFCGSAGPR